MSDEKVPLHFKAHIVLGMVPGLSPSARRVGHTLIEHRNRKTGRCDPSHDRLATILELSEATVYRALAELCDTNGALFEKVTEEGSQRARFYPRWDVINRFYSGCTGACRRRSRDVATITEVLVDLLTEEIGDTTKRTKHVEDEREPVIPESHFATQIVAKMRPEPIEETHAAEVPQKTVANTHRIWPIVETRRLRKTIIMPATTSGHLPALGG